MSQETICDSCGEPIDRSISYYTASVTAVRLIDGVLTSGSSSQQLDYHTEHLPVVVGAHSGDG